MSASKVSLFIALAFYSVAIGINSVDAIVEYLGYTRTVSMPSRMNANMRKSVFSNSPSFN